MTKRWLQFLAGTFLVSGLILAAVEGCKEKGGEVVPGGHTYGLASTSAQIYYQIGSGPQYNISNAAVPPMLPGNTSVTIGLQSNSGVYKATWTVTCPGYYVQPQTFSVLAQDGGNTTSFTFVTPNVVPTYCTVATTTTDGYLGVANAINQFSIGGVLTGTIEVPILGLNEGGVTPGTYGAAVVNSATLLPANAIVTGSYFSPSVGWDAGCNINVALPVEGGQVSIFGFYDASATANGGTLIANGTVSRTALRVYNEAGPIPIEVTLGAQCEGGAGVVGVEYTIPSN